MDMANSHEAEQGPLAASLSMARASRSLAWSIAVKSTTPQDALRVRCLPEPGIVSPIGQLQPEEIALWLAAVPPAPDFIGGSPGALSFAQAASVIDSSESDRLARFLHIEDRISYLAAHAGARFLLGSLVGQPANALRFEPSTHGKPVLVAGPPKLDFSLSHSRGAVSIAAASMPVGVDVEPLRDITDMESVSEIVLAAEERKVLSKAPAAFRSRLFLRYWTLKEAVLKAAAVGFAIAPNTLIVDAGPSPAVLSVPATLGSATQWRLIAPAIEPF
ncbi:MULTISPECIES: 4'-phosphopantetheinyl transferase family protein [unclassified Bradyrhizobium]|uniref:4'-phosphopantetheinyl transferase family protein n=1 Tax=unclassified Bradyrhizobium TaxID=2631580 RepID=UPI002FF279E8